MNNNIKKRLAALEQQSPVNIWKDAPPLPQSTLDKLAEYERDMSDETRAFIAMMERRDGHNFNN